MGPKVDRVPGEGDRDVIEEGRDLEVEDDKGGGVEQYESSTGRIASLGYLLSE